MRKKSSLYFQKLNELKKNVIVYVGKKSRFLKIILLRFGKSKITENISITMFEIFEKQLK
jgi:hypothetical protein